VSAVAASPVAKWRPWLAEHSNLDERNARLYMHVGKLGLDARTLAVPKLGAPAKSILSLLWTRRGGGRWREEREAGEGSKLTRSVLFSSTMGPLKRVSPRAIRCRPLPAFARPVGLRPLRPVRRVVARF
jgi:hypothetical protein